MKDIEFFQQESVRKFMAGLAKNIQQNPWQMRNDSEGNLYVPDCHYAEMLEKTRGCVRRGILWFWTHCPCCPEQNRFRNFCGMKYFEHEMPVHPTLMTRWRKLVDDAGMETMLAETIQAGLRTGAITPRSVETVNVDTTVQEKAISHPTDARLYHVMRGKLVKLVKHFGLELRQSYERVSKTALLLSGRYFHARQTKRAKREVRRLKTWLGRVTRDISRRLAGDTLLEEAFVDLLSKARRLLEQTRDSKNKLYGILKML